ncbi:MAG: septum formation protein Maf [Chlamydiales bacterium]|nr:septum formation protein Maf [Chlamydiia bacterium]MCP5508088.1 septum formation protein Maf [Chlamydiales bacterium]
MKRLILGSGSARRKEIMGYFSYPFEQHVSLFDESTVPFNSNPQAHAQELAEKKAEALHQQFHDAVVLTADTIVYRGGRLYCKPSSLEEAKQFLSELVGKWHSVYTAVSVQHNGKILSGHEETRVLFNNLNDDEISRYLQKIDWRDKAGGYAIQNSGGVIVKQIEGCFYNVMGLPLNLVRKLLHQTGIDLWDYL